MINAVLEKLTREGIDPRLVDSAQILCLPENLLHSQEGDELLETIDMEVLSKMLRASGVSVFTFMDAGRDLAALERRAGDKWFGTVWIRDTAAIPLLIAVIGNIASTEIGEAFKGKESRPDSGAKVHIELIIDDSNGAQKKLKYTGDGETLLGVLKSLQVNAGDEN